MNPKQERLAERLFALSDFLMSSPWGATAREIAERFPDWYGQKSKGTTQERRLYRDLQRLRRIQPIECHQDEGAFRYRRKK